MAEQSDYGGPSFGGVGAYGGGLDAATIAAIEEDEAAMFDMKNMMAATFESDLGWGSLGQMGYGYDKGKHFGLNFEPKIMSPDPYGGWLAPLGAAIAAGLMSGKLGNHDVVSPSVNPHAGFGVDDAPWGVNPLDLDNALSWNPAKVSTNMLPASIEPSMEQMLDWNPPQFHTEFNTNISNPALSPEARKSDLEEANKNIDAWLDGWINSPLSQNVVPLNAPQSPAANWDVEEIENIDVGLPYDPAMAMASNTFNPWEGLNSSVISDIAHNASISDSPGEAEWAAENALYNQLVQQLAPVEPLNPRDTAGRQTANAPRNPQPRPAPWLPPVVRSPAPPPVAAPLPAGVKGFNEWSGKAAELGWAPDQRGQASYQGYLGNLGIKARPKPKPKPKPKRKPKPTPRMSDR